MLSIPYPWLSDSFDTICIYYWWLSIVETTLTPLYAFLKRPSKPLKKLSHTIILIAIHYSYLKASIGFSLAAFRAGKYPKATPTNAENPKPIMIEYIAVGIKKPVAL